MIAQREQAETMSDMRRQKQNRNHDANKLRSDDIYMCFIFRCKFEHEECQRL